MESLREDVALAFKRCNQLERQLAAQTALVERLSAPVSLMEWSAGSPLSADAVKVAAKGCRTFARIIATRKSTPEVTG